MSPDQDALSGQVWKPHTYELSFKVSKEALEQELKDMEEARKPLDRDGLLNALTRRVVAARLQRDALLREEKLLGEALTRLRTGEPVLVVEARLLSYGLEL